MPDTAGTGTMRADNRKSGVEWWRGAVIYQIYPRSFYDSNGDGVGDLYGIMQNLDYVASLGVDGIWISPFFRSPMKDFGYDVADYRDVDPIFGRIEDFDLILSKAHDLGLKVIIDFVASHTSDRHAWFQESRQNRTNAKADWYVWADPKPDGTPPNNWISVFGGSSWAWEARRQQYYLHNFLTSQPDLNIHNPDVRRALLEEMEFWLARGVDGFRLDALNFCAHDLELRDNPPRPGGPRDVGNITEVQPYTWQTHIHDISRPEALVFVREIRALLDRYAGTFALAEILEDRSWDSMRDYANGCDRLHTGYSFDFLRGECTAPDARRTLDSFQDEMPEGWPTWAMSNHDVARVATRWSPDGRVRDEQVKMLLAMLVTMRGTALIYQGEELGLPEADVPWDMLQDPWGLEFWPEFKGRDGCRTPLPWNADEPHAGFSQPHAGQRPWEPGRPAAAADPWLPIPHEHAQRAISRQEADPNSCLHFTRNFLSWRKVQTPLLKGTHKSLDAPEPVVAFIREHEGKAILAAFNLGNESVECTLEGVTGSFGMLDGHGLPGQISTGEKGAQLVLPPFGGVFARLG